MRLIDADKILYFKGKDIVGEEAYITDRETIDAMPTVDAEPIIRCEDCKQWDAELECCTSYTIVKCTDGREGVESKADNFCSRGELK